jgi:hypothetical protein
MTMWISLHATFLLVVASLVPAVSGTICHPLSTCPSAVRGVDHFLRVYVLHFFTPAFSSLTVETHVPSWPSLVAHTPPCLPFLRSV